MWLLALWTGCCRGVEAPVLEDPGTLTSPSNVALEVPLEELAPGVDTEALSAWGDDHVDAVIQGDVLRIVPEPDWSGLGEVGLMAIGDCQTHAELTFEVAIGDVPTDTTDVPDDLLCPTTFRYEVRGGASDVSVAGTFNGWDASATPMEEVSGGVFGLTLDLAPGDYAYKFVERDGGDTWTCDPDAPYFQCDEGTPYEPECPLGADACNSMKRVPDCRRPRLVLGSLSVDRDAGRADVSVSWAQGLGHGELDAFEATLDGEVLENFSADGSTVALTGLSEGRHTLRMELTDTDGFEAEPLYVPFWTDDRSWGTGVLYYAFVDRFENGDTSLDGAEGTSLEITDYLGGDWAGLTERLDYLDALGVTALWITAPQDNPAGAWGEKCGQDFSGYHGYWPASQKGLEDHFGDEEDFRTLIDEAHARGMRVLTDWVANHVHTDHAWWSSHSDWFNDRYICEEDEDGDGVVNWDQRPETCWFDDFLPDLRYYELEPLVRSVDDAIDFIKEWELDGYRVDAVKHMPHSVYTNLQARIRDEIEHGYAGGDEDFYTVGETFTTDRGLVAAYVNEEELDAQFDFPLYFDILSILGRGEGELWELEASHQQSEIEYYPATMSTFLGNHDVERFIAHAAGEVGSLWGDGMCPDGPVRVDESAPDWDEPYERLELAWTWLFTRRGLPLVYYGDELGLPGYYDPDNRQLMRFPGELSDRERGVLEHVCALANGRQQWPVLAEGTGRIWMGYDPGNGVYDPDRIAWTRVDGLGDQVLVVVNRAGEAETLRNRIEWAGLKGGTTFVDLLTGDEVTADGDLLEFEVGARSARVWVSPADDGEVDQILADCAALSGG